MTTRKTLERQIWAIGAVAMVIAAVLPMLVEAAIAATPFAA